MELFIIIVPLFIVLFVGLAIYGHKKEKERRERLRAWAEQNELRFSPAKVYGMDDDYPDFGCLSTGSGRYAYNMVAGTMGGFKAKFFDYHYETHSTDSKGRRQTHHHHFSAVIVESPFLLEPLSIRPEGLLDKLSAAFGWDDIDFESAEFSRRFHVKSPDKRWAFDVIHGRVMEMLLEVKGMYFECDAHSMVCYEGSKRFEVPEFQRAFDRVSTILNHIPDHAKERIANHA